MNTPAFKIHYNSKDITRDIAQYIKAIEYTDNMQGKSDTLSIELDDTEKLFQGAWYPLKKDAISASMGYSDLMFDCGVFEVDTLKASGPPQSFSINCLAAGVSSAIRTGRSRAHDDKTLREIANTVAVANGLQLQGKIADIRINSCVQKNETDLGFLYRLAYEYGYAFSVRGGVITFTSLYDLDASPAVIALSSAEIDGAQRISRYSFDDTLTGVYRKARNAYQYDFEGENVEASAVGFLQSSDELEMRMRAESVLQAEAKAKSLLYRKNTEGVTMRFDTEGNPLLLAGNTVKIVRMGEMSGLYKIDTSTHRIAGTYTTSCECRRVGSVLEAEK